MGGLQKVLNVNPHSKGLPAISLDGYSDSTTIRMSGSDTWSVTEWPIVTLKTYTESSPLVVGSGNQVTKIWVSNNVLYINNTGGGFSNLIVYMY